MGVQDALYSWMRDAVRCVHPQAKEHTAFTMLSSYMDESERSADLSFGSAAFSFKSSPSHRLANARGQ